VQARDGFGEVLSIFTQIKDWRNVAITYVNLARTTYRLGDHDAASHYLQESLSISRELNIRWTLGFVLEIMGLLQRKVGAYDRALELFQESLRLSVEQDNQQGIANCLGALAGLAALTSQPERAARLFAAAARLRKAMGATMSNNDHLEYENYLTLVHEQLDHATFESEWSDGFTMTTEKIIADLDEWSANSMNGPIQGVAPVPGIQTAYH
jgi:tetratricopeptide (TPR) repeat protein